MIHHQLPLPVCLVLLWSGCLLRWTYAAGGPLEWNRVVENGQTLRPAPRKHAALGYDTVRHYVVLFGGEGEKGKIYSDTWIFDILAKDRNSRRGETEKTTRCNWGHFPLQLEFHIRVGHVGWHLPRRYPLLRCEHKQLVQRHGACPSSDSWLFDLQTQSWQSLPNCAVPRYSATAVNLQTQENPQFKQTAALIYGGKLESSQHLFGRSRLDEDEVVIFDAEKQTWSIRSVRPAPTAGRFLDADRRLAPKSRQRTVQSGHFQRVRFTRLVHVHRLHADSPDRCTICTIVGVCFITAGALSAMAAQSDRKHFNSVHAILGLIILILLVLQCLFGLVFIKKVTSIQFRRAHLWIAFAILVMAFLNTFLGLQLLGAPSTVTIALGGLLIGFLIVLAILLLYSARSPAQAASQPPRSD
ncbi:hypothetical protein T02_14744 [Trichinella nativa]|uniref:ascorbate ferrireductase (transmembrane) n=1 Tax=Trichinella nativa TaxID=6335 RepID=A0A0V1LM29_9BILA|nr:hypothetical protein T02_14744 [Trichinella nativa]